MCLHYTRCSDVILIVPQDKHDIAEEQQTWLHVGILKGSHLFFISDWQPMKIKSATSRCSSCEWLAAYLRASLQP